MARSTLVTDLNVVVMAQSLSGWPTAENGLRVRILMTEVPKERVGRFQVDAELLDDVALDFRDGHLEHDLIATLHDNGVDDLAAFRGDRRGGHAEQAGGDVEGLLRLGLA